MDVIVLCYFWGNMKKKLIFKLFKQIYVLSVIKQKLEKKNLYLFIFYKMYCNNKLKRVIQFVILVKFNDIKLEL